MIRNLMNRKKKAFTLIELIIVIAIIAILAAIAVPQFGKIRSKANVSTDISNAKTIHSTVATMIADETIILPTGGSGQVYDIITANATGSPLVVDAKIYELTSVGQSNININNETDGNLNPKAVQQSKFQVALDSKGNISIFVTKITGGTTGNAYQIYPQVKKSVTTNQENTNNPYGVN